MEVKNVQKHFLSLRAKQRLLRRFAPRHNTKQGLNYRMCLTIPGQIITIKNRQASIKYHTGTKTAKIVTGRYKIGDYVIVQAGLVIEKVPPKQVMTWQKFLKDDA